MLIVKSHIELYQWTLAVLHGRSIGNKRVKHDIVQCTVCYWMLTSARFSSFACKTILLWNKFNLKPRNVCENSTRWWTKRLPFRWWHQCNRHQILTEILPAESLYRDTLPSSLYKQQLSRSSHFILISTYKQKTKQLIFYTIFDQCHFYALLKLINDVFIIMKQLYKRTRLQLSSIT